MSCFMLILTWGDIIFVDVLHRAIGCTWLLQGVKISISTDRNVNN